MHLVAFICTLLLPTVVLAAPTIKLGPENATVSKGQVLDVWATISTDGPLAGAEVSLQLPYGFRSTFVPMAGAAFDPEANVVRVSGLAGRSTIELLFRIKAPSVFGHPAPGGEEDDAGRLGTISTQREKHIVVNLRHETDVGPQQISVDLDLRYTTVMWLYVLCGVMGIALGHLAKVVGEDRRKLVSALALGGNQGAWYRLGNLLRYAYVDRMPSFITVLIIGFAALLALSADGMPVSSWDQSIALGLGLAVVSDDKLLERARSAVV